MDPERHPPGEDPLIGRTIADKFRIEARVGRGAMGCVYRATQLNLKKTVAIKVLHPSPDGDSAYSHRFKREAKAASRLDHPNSLRVIDFGDDDGLLYIAMEFLQGRDLLAVLREEFPLARERVVNILSQVLAALAVAHEMGVIHRDLKPENIMLLASRDDEGNPIEVVKVCDFGIAKIVEADVEELGAPEGRTATATGTLTGHGMLIGTPEYMSPEQARGEPAGVRSDIYSLGVILYQMLTARLPFVATSKLRLVIKHVEERPAPPSSIDSHVDLGLEAVCMRALEKRPEDRYESARAMRAALRAALDVRESLRQRIAPSVPPPVARPSSQGVPAATRAAEIAQPTPSRPSERRVPLELLSGPTMSAVEDPAEAAAALIEARKRLSGASQAAHPAGVSAGDKSPAPPAAAAAPPAAVAAPPAAAAAPPVAAGFPVGLVVAGVAVLGALAYFALR